MKYLLLGSLGNINKPLAEELITAGHEVTIVTSQASRRQDIAALGAKAAVGSVEDVAFLERVFTGQDALYTMIPPKWDAVNWKEWIATTGKGYARAIQGSGVRKVVNLSSIGSHMPTGGGPVSGIHFAEEALQLLTGVDILHLRPAFYYTNFLQAIGMIKGAGFYGNNYGPSRRIVMVHPRDIAAVAAEALLKPDFTGQGFRFIAGDERTSLEIASVLGAAIGKADLPYVEFRDEDALQGMLQAGVSEEVARNFTEMGAAVRNGEMFAVYERNKPRLSPTKLEDFAKEFAEAYGRM
jgi:uncharacterized protein YbjT (DUF2867 family)